MKMQLYIAACIVLFVVPPVFVWNRVYKDGVVGRIALLFISFASATVLLNLYDERDLVPSFQTVVALVSFAVFLVWHLIRFHTRVSRAALWEGGRVEGHAEGLAEGRSENDSPQGMLKL